MSNLSSIERKYIYYSADKFYRHKMPNSDIKDEIDEVESFVKNIIAGKNEKRAIFLRGARGAGKTWSCLHLHRTVFATEEYRNQVMSFLIRFWPLEDEEKPNKLSEWWLSEKLKLHNNQDDEVFYDLISTLEDTFQIPHLENQDWEFRIRQIILNVDSSKKNFLLIIDSVNEGVMQGYETLFNRIQSYLLAPLLNTGRCAIVLTGRGTSPTYRSYYLRDMDTVEIDPLPLDAVRKILYDYESPHVKDQPQETAEENVKAIFELSDGYALLVRLIAQQKSTDLKTTVEKVQKEIIQSLADERSVVEGLEKISVLSVPFRDSDVLPLFEGTGATDDGLALIRQLRENLLKQSLLEWDTNNKGYQISPSVLHFYREALCRYKPDQYKKYSLTLIENFQRIIEDYPNQPEVSNYYSKQSERLQQSLETDCAKETAL